MSRSVVVSPSETNTPGRPGRAPSGGRSGPMLRAATAVIAHPGLWITALRQVFRLAPRGWWRRGRLPVPDGAYLGFRLETQYGSAEAPPSREDLVRYLRWVRDWDHHR